MQDAFGIVVVVVSLLALVVAVIALASSGRAFDQVGRGGLSIGDEAPATRADPGLREEARAVVAAHNRRRVAHAQEPLDVEAEVSRWLAELGGG